MVDAAHMEGSLERVLLSEEQIHARLAEMAAQIAQDYAGKDLLLVGVLKGAVLVMADLMRAMPYSVRMDWMAVSSYGSGTKSSGVVRIVALSTAVPNALGSASVTPSPAGPPLGPQCLRRDL